MNLKFVEKGTRLDVFEITKNDEVIKEYNAKFYDTVTPISFLVESEDIYENINDIDRDNYLKISFFRGSNMYTFKGKIKENTVINGHNLTQIDQKTEIIVSTRRTSPRHEIVTSVILYESLQAREANESLATGQILDISNDALCFLSNKSIAVLEPEHIYFLEFFLSKSDRFLLPALLKRRGNSPQSVQFKYDYGFIFDYTDRPDQRTRLITSIFKHKMNGLM